MLYQDVYLEKARTMANSGEYTVDITPRDPITALFLKFNATNGATINQNASMPLVINSIEVIDGADVVFSLDGPEVFALAAHQMGRLPLIKVNEIGGDNSHVTLPVLFGRYLGDTDLAFDPTKFRNPQVRVNWNLANVGAVGASHYAGADLQMTILAKVMSGAPSPAGVLSAKERYTYSTSAAGTEYIEMPTDEVWRKLLLRPVLADNSWTSCLTNIKLSCDGGKFVPLDIGSEDLLLQQALYEDRFSYRMVMRGINNRVLNMVLRYEPTITVMSNGLADTVYEATNIWHGDPRILMQTGGVVVAANVNAEGIITGYNPYDVVAVPLGKQQEIADWFPAPAFGSIRLEILAGVAAVSNYVCLQTLRTY